MRAIFTKDLLILVFFLASGLTLFIAMVFSLGFDRAFVIPRFRIPDELIATWIGWGLLFGWVMGATDQVRGLTDYVAHRGFSKVRLFWTQHGLASLVMAAVLTVPWALLAILGKGIFEPDYAGIGAHWLIASTVVLPCYAVGVFAAKLPLHIGVRIALTFPLTFWIVGERPDRLLEIGMIQEPMGLGIMHALTGLGLLFAASCASASSRDSDLPVPGTAILPAVVLLLGVGWSLHALQSAAMYEITRRVDRIQVGQRTDGTFTLFTRQHLQEGGSRDWEVDPKTHKPTVPNAKLDPVTSNYGNRNLSFRGASQQHQVAFSTNQGHRRRVRAYGTYSGEGLVHLVDRDGWYGERLYLEKQDGPFSLATRFFDPRRYDVGHVLWAGDPKDGSVWYCDVAQEVLGYVPLALIGGDQFVRWIEPTAEGRRIAKALASGDYEGPNFNLAFFQTTGGISYVDRNTYQVNRLPDPQVAWMEEVKAVKDGPVLRVSQVGLLFHEVEVHDQDGEVPFTFRFVPTTVKERWIASLAAIASVMHPPVLAPMAFGNITHAAVGRWSTNASEVDAAQNPIQFMSMNANPFNRVHWTGYSPWSSIAWILLIGLAYLTRRGLTKNGATGPRLWLWPLAVLAFGPLACILQLAMEPKRAFYPLAKTKTDPAAVLISDPV